MVSKKTNDKLRTAQRAMERKMLDLKLQDKIPCSEIRKRTKIIDIIEYTLKQKWKWAGHIARMKDNRWTKRCTEWQPRRGKRSRGRPSRRWHYDITEKEGTTWIRKATGRRQLKTLMEGCILQWMDKALMKTKTRHRLMSYDTMAVTRQRMISYRGLPTRTVYLKHDI